MAPPSLSWSDYLLSREVLVGGLAVGVASSLLTLAAIAASRRLARRTSGMLAASVAEAEARQRSFEAYALRGPQEQQRLLLLAINYRVRAVGPVAVVFVILGVVWLLVDAQTLWRAGARVSALLSAAGTLIAFGPIFLRVVSFLAHADDLDKARETAERTPRRRAGDAKP